jgi:hypothetical protein
VLGRCVVTDLHSLNGVWVNRACLRPGKDVEVGPNDIIYFGEQRAAFRLVALLPDNFPPAVSVALVSATATAELMGQPTSTCYTCLSWCVSEREGGGFTARKCKDFERKGSVYACLCIAQFRTCSVKEHVLHLPVHALFLCACKYLLVCGTP